MFQKINFKNDVGIFEHVLEKNKIQFHTGNFLLNTPLKYKTSGNLGFRFFPILMHYSQYFVYLCWCRGV